ncbi:MAG: hypothetical protein J3K34DRAFT_419127 [Monoraphidium minutum]|nr:MAG: hypothetical protein J3K34DRAFT_419127 [Monoraphidium minutum]
MSSDADADMLHLLAAGSVSVPPLLALPSLAARHGATAAAGLAALRGALPWAARLQLAVALALLCIGYLSVLRAAAAPGAGRLLLVPPVVAANLVIPLLFDVRSELLTRVAAAFLFAWLANFKAAGLAVNRGPLAMSHWGFWQLALLYIVPIYPTESKSVGRSGRLGDSVGGARQLLGRFVAQTALFVAIALVLISFDLPAVLRYYAYALGLYGFISFLMTGPAVPLTSVAGLEVVPPFDAPWMSASLAEFWARRWNNTVGLTLRSLCYDPIIEGRLVREGGDDAHDSAGGACADGAKDGQQGEQQAAAPPRPSRRRRFWGTAAVFAASGLAHELVFAYSMAPKFVWGASMFFFVQAPLLQLENSILRCLKAAGRTPPWAVRWLAAQAALMAAAHLFFFPLLEAHTDTAQRVCAAISENVQLLGAALRA